MGKNSSPHLFSLCLWNDNFPTIHPQPALYTQIHIETLWLLAVLT